MGRTRMKGKFGTPMPAKSAWDAGCVPSNEKPTRYPGKPEGWPHEWPSERAGLLWKGTDPDKPHKMSDAGLVRRINRIRTRNCSEYRERKRLRRICRLAGVYQGDKDRARDAINQFRKLHRAEMDKAEAIHRSAALGNRSRFTRHEVEALAASMDKCARLRDAIEVAEHVLFDGEYRRGDLLAQLLLERMAGLPSSGWSFKDGRSFTLEHIPQGFRFKHFIDILKRAAGDRPQG